jgi:uncharacterized protein YjbI with pentapeptide repeats
MSPKKINSKSFTGEDLSNTDFRGTEFSNADLRSVGGLSSIELPPLPSSLP